MSKAFLLVCALFIAFALLFLPCTEARALLKEGSTEEVPPCSRHVHRVASCPEPPPGCIPGKTCSLPP
ncbi:hypothetical protein NL676_014697 [Syzygium grande]|nr:hypothetical protein NL676_014697 [Syzygium grande]